MIKPIASLEVLRHDSPALIAAVAELRRRHVVNGVLAGTGSHTNSPGTTVATIAAFNEFGTRRAPARPFMRTAYTRLFRKHQAEIKGAMLKALLTRDGKAIRKSPAVKSFYAVLGMTVQRLMRENIRHSRLLFAPNAETTKDLKGSAQPLFDTGEMLKSLSYEVRS